MRLAKKTLYWFMALLPILTLLLPLPMTFQALRSENDVNSELVGQVLNLYLQPGNYSYALSENGEINIISDGSIAGYCTVISEHVFGFYENYNLPLQQVVLQLSYKIEQTAGYQMETFLAVFACMYHLFIMYIVEFLMALICFIPKKCSELFGG